MESFEESFNLLRKKIPGKWIEMGIGGFHFTTKYKNEYLLYLKRFSTVAEVAISLVWMICYAFTHTIH